MANFIIPELQPTFFIPGTATPGNGVKLFIYTNLSATKTTSYKSKNGAAHTNPIVLDSGGNLPSQSQVWIPSGVTITAVYAPANDTDPPASPYLTLNDLAGVNDVTATASEWQAGPTPTYVSATSFTLVGDQRTTFKAGGRLQTTNTGGTIYSVITSVQFGALTTVNVVNDSGSLDSGLSAVNYGLLAPEFTSIDAYHVDKKSAAIASQGNGTTNIWGLSGNFAHITGTNTIHNFSSASYAGAAVDLIFDGVLSINSSASITLPGNANFTTAVNDAIRVRAETVSTAVVTYYQGGFSSQLPQVSNTIFAGPVSGASARPTFRELVGIESALTLLAVKTVSSSSALTFSSTEVNFTAYDKYQFEITGFQCGTHASILGCAVSHNGGAGFNTTTVYQVAGVGNDVAAGNASSGAISQAFFQLYSLATAQGQISTATFAAHGTFTLFTPNNSTQSKFASSDMNYENQNTRVVKVLNAMTYTGSTAPISGLSFQYNTGVINVGKIAVYGFRT